MQRISGLIDREYNGGKWTRARFNSFVKSVLRSASRRWEPKYACLNDAFVAKQINKKSGRIAKHYSCNSCKEAFPSADVQVDHISPIIDPQTGFTTWDEVINNLFCERDNLQVLCTSCHNTKTAEEKQQAKERKNDNR